MTNQKIKTQLVVLGAGPGGYAAAFHAADLGMQVTLVDQAAKPGGVCLYRGCIPSKALLHVAKMIDEAKAASAHGVSFAAPQIDLAKLRGFKDDIVKKLTGGLGQLSKAREVNFVQGTASLTDSKSLRVVSNEGIVTEVEFQNLIIATGSSPNRLPGVSEADPRIWDSTDALKLDEIPQTLMVIGGGYIGLELGSVYASLGTQVSVIEMGDTLLPGIDADLTRILQKQLQKKFDDFFVSSKVLGIESGTEGLNVMFEDSDREKYDADYDRVLVAIGRHPNTKNLGLAEVGVQIDERGFIKVNPERETSVKGIYAIGDCAGGLMLAHKASHEGLCAVDNIAGHARAFAPKAIPAVIFTDPEIAWCGLSETEAAAQNIAVTVNKFPWAASGRAMSIGRTEGLTKLLTDPNTHKVLGLAMAGPGAGDMIAEGVLAIEMGATAQDLKHSIHAHPTLSETVMEAAELVYGQCTHMYKPTRRS